MSPEQKEALKLWHSWGSRSYRNPVLNAAYSSCLVNVGIVCEYVQYDPTTLLESCPPALFLVQRRFKLSAAKDASIRELFSQFSAHDKAIAVSLEEPFRLSFSARRTGVHPDAIEAASVLLKSGFEAKINERFEAAIESFRTTVDLAFMALLEEASCAEAVPHFMRDPADYYRSILAEIAR
jgi:hypothetical protein